MPRKILVTGGLGYIGSHTCVELLFAGHEVVIVDNLENSKAQVAHKIEQITGKPVKVYWCNILDARSLNNIFHTHKFDSVFHFAGVKSVSESASHPLHYYDNNVMATLVLLNTMRSHNVRTLVFSSSATVYRNSMLPFKEDSPLAPSNTYGRTKLMAEDMLRDLYASDASWHISILRYFNPAGAHPSGMLGEDPRQPNNLMPYLVEVAAGKRPYLQVFGEDYDTPNGTCVRDYIHVVDLARGHLKALQRPSTTGVFTYNLGTGYGVSVLSMIEAFEKATGIKIPYQIASRRVGDVAVSRADVQKAQRELNWIADRNVRHMCADAWRYYQMSSSAVNNDFERK